MGNPLRMFFSPPYELMVLVDTKPNAHKGLSYEEVVRSLGLYARRYWMHDSELAPKVMKFDSIVGYG